MFTKFCAGISKISLVLAVLGLIAVILCVQWQVIGRYVLNDTPTWAEALAMLIVLFVTAFGLAVGVRDAGHIGLESLVVLLPEPWQRKIELLIHFLSRANTCQEARLLEGRYLLDIKPFPQGFVMIHNN